MSKLLHFLSIILTCVLLGVVLIVKQAEAIPIDMARTGNFSLTCEHLILDEDTKLSADCERKDNKGMQRSGIYLNKYITNKGGDLEWNSSNGNFMYSCKDSYLKVIHRRSAILHSKCKQRSKDAPYRETAINLDYKIMNDDGILKFN